MDVDSNQTTLKDESVCDDNDGKVSDDTDYEIEEEEYTEAMISFAVSQETPSKSSKRNATEKDEEVSDNESNDTDFEIEEDEITPAMLSFAEFQETPSKSRERECDQER